MAGGQGAERETHLHCSFAVCCRPDDVVSMVGEQQELSGTFISDRGATMAYLRSTGVYSPEQPEKIGSLMQTKMNVAFIGDTVVTELNDYNTSELVKIVEQGAVHIAMITTLVEESVRNRIEYVLTGIGGYIRTARSFAGENSGEFAEAGNYL